MGETDTGETDRFAYGDNTVDGVACPVVAAGYDVDAIERHIGMVETYDHEVCKRLRQLGHEDPAPSGTCSRATAKRAWAEALEQLRVVDSKQVARDVRFGERVERKLFR